MGWKIIAVAFTFGLLALAPVAGSAPPSLTVEQVLANPAVYDGKSVRVRGFATFLFENCRLWPEEAAFRTLEIDRALWINTKGLAQATRDMTSGHLVYVTGTFRSGGSRPRLTKVTSVERDPTDTGPARDSYAHGAGSRKCAPGIVPAKPICSSTGDARPSQ